jgi:hypothetical protein
MGMPTPCAPREQVTGAREAKTLSEGNDHTGTEHWPGSHDCLP